MSQADVGSGDAQEVSALRLAGRFEPAGRPAGPLTEALAPDGLPLEPLVVRIRHASLEHAPYPLVVGHFQGLPLTGAEARLNDRLGGRLDRALLLNLYPQAFGESILLDSVDGAPPPVVVVVGLGPSGELTGSELRGVVTRALLRYAARELEQRLASGAVSPDPPLGLSSVLVGSSESGALPVEASVRAVIEAVVAANSRLRRVRVDLGKGEVPATDVVRFEFLELIERYADRVDLVVAVLEKLAALEASERAKEGGRLQAVEYQLSPEKGEGGSTANPPLDAADDIWRRVDIRAVEREADPPGLVRLEFTSIGRLARAERLLGEVETTLVEPLLAEAVNTDANPQVAGTLYELLIPQMLKGELGSGENLQLLVDERTADYPWELLSPRPDDAEQPVPLALRVRVLRQFRQHEGLRFDIRRASANNVLVVGNPPTDGFAPLPGAVREAKAVAEIIDRTPDWNVTARVWDTNKRVLLPKGSSPLPPEQVLHDLLNGDWRIVHIAAHGDFTGEPTTSGVVLGGLRLTANVFAKLSVVPDLVVLNACHLGRLAEHPLTGANRVAASVARALLGIGVRAVIVAGWAVNDAAAAAFAGALYEDLLSGDDFAAAVKHAREAAWAEAPRSLTWGAYQCYGDPDFRVTMRPRPTTGAQFHTVSALRRRIQRLLVLASDQGRSARVSAEDMHGLDEELASLADQARALDSAAALADLAEVHGELLQLDRAIGLYEEAFLNERSEVPLSAVGQVGNLLIRSAQRRYRNPQHEAELGPVASDEATRAEQWLSRAIDLGETGERLALLGSLHKKLATMAEGEKREEHLLKAVGYYAKAERKRPRSYHRLAWVQLASIADMRHIDVPEEWRVAPVVEWDDGRPSISLPSTSDAAKVKPPVEGAGAERRAPRGATDFWGRAEAGDTLLTAGIVEGRFREGTDLAATYLKAFRIRSSRRERASVTDHLGDLVELLPVDHPLKAQLAKAFERLDAEVGPSEPSASAERHG